MLPLSFYKTPGYHSTKRAGELPTAEYVEEHTDDGVQQEQFARMRYEGHDLTYPRLADHPANKDCYVKANQRESE